MDGWSYIQTVDYEQLPFKCKYYHEYGHFAKNCPKVTQEHPKNKASEQWQQEKCKKMMNRLGNPQLEHKSNSRPPSPSKGKSTIQIEDEAESIKNKFESLETSDPELISSKENTKENTHDLDAVIEI